MFGKKKLANVLSSLTTIQSDLKEVNSDEKMNQKTIKKDSVKLEVKRSESRTTMDLAKTVLNNVNTLLGTNKG